MKPTKTDTERANEPAFPVYPRIEGNLTKQIEGATGMTLRDYFAIHADRNDVRKMWYDKEGSLGREIKWPEARYLFADSMLREREARGD